MCIDHLAIFLFSNINESERILCAKLFYYYSKICFECKNDSLLLVYFVF